ncbi:thioredoxin domain-containing protein 17-like isoform X1 [Sitophilus oryzae]|uniref:Thioredoxin domain-containing protein 17 n=1 Tax=Sitophilus oryzae TaxID=7048 RepID=A0A6J2YXT6_SITOR|nr:thioredoxin domain-containing protein 17-like isoform X1 [Sitophilus oryzae]
MSDVSLHVSLDVSSNENSVSRERTLSESKGKIQKFRINTYDEFQTSLDKYGHLGFLFLYFTGSELSKDGYDWCPECSEALPIIEQEIDNACNVVFFLVEVGNEEQWQCKENPYRSHPNLNLKVVPTFMKWNSHRRLEGDYCAKAELVQLLFEDNCSF